MALRNVNTSNPSTVDFAALPSLRAGPINITLIRQPFGADSSFQQRQLVINPGEPVVVGRASKSESKNCRPHPFNALFDCPVVSRTHAEFRSNAFKPESERVCIVDRGSMHGTTVNDVRLVPFEPHTLHTGDIIKFGDQVIRGAELHDGVRVVFRLDDASQCNKTEPCSLAGTTFGVPSASEAESEAEDDQDSLASPILAPLGSQQQPIDLEQPHGPLYHVIDLDEEDDERRPVIPLWDPPAKKSVPDTYVESDAESIVQHNTGLQGILLDDGSDNRSVICETFDDEVESESSDGSPRDVDDTSSSYASILSRESRSASVSGADYGEQEGSGSESDGSLLDPRSSPELVAQKGSTSHLQFNEPEPIRYTRWDVRPNQSQQLYRPLYPNRNSIPSEPSPSYWPGDQPLPATSAPPLKPDVSPTASRISIPNLVQQTSTSTLHPDILPDDTLDANLFDAAPKDMEATEPDPLRSNASPLSSSSEIAVSSGTKRKADEISSDDTVLSQDDENWKELYDIVFANQAETIVPSSSEALEKMVPPAKKVRVQKRKGSKLKKVAKYAAIGGASALAGGVGMFTFLISPLAQRIIEWASV